MVKRKHRPRRRFRPIGHMVTIGVTWYTEDQWQLVKSAATDAERFENTYAEWVAMAEESMKRMHAPGVVTQRVPIVASELLAWCLEHDRENNAAARAEFVRQVLTRQHGVDD